jgi:putative ABC transport system permease protein
VNAGSAAAVGPQGGRAQPILFPWRLLTYQKGRTAIAAAAIGFAVLVMFMQLGFYGSTVETATSTPARFDADLFLVSTSFVQLAETGEIPRERLTQALAAPGVAEVTPLYTRALQWNSLDGSGSCFAEVFAYPVSERRPLRLVGIDAIEPLLTEAGTVSVDSKTQPNCPKLTDTIKLRDQLVNVVGKHTLGMGFLAATSVVTTPTTFSRLFPELKHGKVSMGIVYIERGRDPAQVVAWLKKVLPADTAVLTADDFRALQLRYWVDNTAIGNIFGIGTVVGFIVGLVVVYQVLSSGVRSQLAQYAVLRAIGCSDRAIYGSVLVQGWLLTLFGFIPGLVCALGLYAGMENATMVAMPMPLPRLLTVLALSLGLATISGLLSLRKLESADPATLF